jgi:predicted nucleic acid-binding protein
VDAVDSDVVIFAAKRDPRGAVVERLVRADAASGDVVGSVVLVSEVFATPVGIIDETEFERLITIIATLHLKDVDYEIADLAGTLRTKYRLKTPDALHLATAVLWGADRFHTNNRTDFGQGVDEIEIVFPDLP